MKKIIIYREEKEILAKLIDKKEDMVCSFCSEGGKSLVEINTECLDDIYICQDCINEIGKIKI